MEKDCSHQQPFSLCISDIVEFVLTLCVLGIIPTPHAVPYLLYTVSDSSHHDSFDSETCFVCGNHLFLGQCGVIWTLPALLQGVGLEQLITFYLLQSYVALSLWQLNLTPHSERQSGYLFIPVPRAAHSHRCGCRG